METLQIKHKLKKKVARSKSMFNNCWPRKHQWEISVECLYFASEKMHEKERKPTS